MRAADAAMDLLPDAAPAAPSDAGLLGI